MKTTHKILLLVLPLILIAFFANPAAAQNNYFSWKVGISEMEIENIEGIGSNASETVNKTSADDDVTAFSVAYGHRFTENILPIRLEIELSFRTDFDYSATPIFSSAPGLGDISSDINSHTLFANLYIDLLQDSPIIPYIGGGVGIAWNIWEDDYAWWWDDSETTTELAWNVGGGIALKLNRRLMLDVSYHYIDFGEAELSDLLKINELTTNEVRLGLRLNF